MGTTPESERGIELIKEEQESSARPITNEPREGTGCGYCVLVIGTRVLVMPRPHDPKHFLSIGYLILFLQWESFMSGELHTVSPNTSDVQEISNVIYRVSFHQEKIRLEARCNSSSVLVPKLV